MFRKLLILFVILVFVLVTIIAFRSRFFALSVNPPSAQKAVPKTVPTCSVPAASGVALPAVANITGGSFSDQQIIIPAGTNIFLTSSLILVANDLLQVDGTITVNPIGVPFGRQVNITLVSQNNNVVIGPAGQVGSASAQSPSKPMRTVTGRIASAFPGTNGGYVRLLSPGGGIDIQGNVEGFGGGNGGKATSKGVILTGMSALAGAGPRSEAVAVGGQGGFGGDVRLCALDGINIGSAALVRGGMGGGMGHAFATAGSGKDAHASGGPANNGGNILIDGLVPGMAVINAGRIEGGSVDWAGAAFATGGASTAVPLNGGKAVARGGLGGDGGTVLFSSCVVTPPVGIINAHLGGDGGTANATGGNGFSSLVTGKGGNADAWGGFGGQRGALPQIPTPAGVVPGGTSGIGATWVGTGGTATARSGNGGTRTTPPPPLPALNGGNSGNAFAQGGTGAGGTGATVAISAATAAVAPAGAGGTTVTSAGTP